MTQYSGVFTLQQQGQALTSGQWCTDPYFKNTTLLLHADGVANSAQNNTFLDSSTNAFTITRNGNTTQGSFTPYGPTWSNYLPGSLSSYYTISASSVFNFGTSDFTIEFWFNLDAGATTRSGFGRSHIISPSEADTATMFSFKFTGSTEGSTGVLVYLNNSTLITYSSAITAGVWHHLALTRSGTSLRLFLDGEIIGTATNSSSISGTAPVNVGVLNSIDPTYSDYYTGYISNLRVTKSAALYTAAFIPSTAPLTTTVPSGTVSLLAFSSSRLVDVSGTATVSQTGTPSVQRFSPFAPQYQYTPAVIGGSGYFDGSGDYLTAPDNAAFELGTSDFTIEGWFLPLLASRPFLSKDQNENVNYGNLVFGVNGSGVPFLLCNPNSGNATDRVTLTATSSVLGSWNHVAATRSGSTWRIFVNGVLQNTATSTVGYRDSSSLFYVGCTLNSNNPTDFYQGHMCDVRLVKGTAVYTSTFTPPTAPLTAISNTSFLLNFTNAGIYDNAMMNDLETVGNAQVSTNVVKYGSGSMYFDGSGDYLYLHPSPDLALGTGDFTVEMWVNASSTPSDVGIFESRTNGLAATENGFTLTAFSSSVIRIYSNGILISSSSTSYVGTWCHVAVTRSSGTWYLFINGVSQGTSTASRNMTNTDAIIGGGRYGANGTVTTFFPGYIDDLRITKGVARYTANFQPPKVAFANQ